MAGRPKLGTHGDGLHPLNLGVRADELAEVEKCAERESLSVSAVVRLALRAYFGLEPIPEKKIT